MREGAAAPRASPHVAPESYPAFKPERDPAFAGIHNVALEALRKAWQAKRVTMDALWHFAGICRMTNVMRPYLESLT